MEGVSILSLLSAAKNLGCLGGNGDPSLRSAVTFVNNPGYCPPVNYRSLNQARTELQNSELGAC
jgi:hypothetical protein